MSEMHLLGFRWKVFWQCAYLGFGCHAHMSFWIFAAFSAFSVSFAHIPGLALHKSEVGTQCHIRLHASLVPESWFSSNLCDAIAMQTLLLPHPSLP